MKNQLIGIVISTTEEKSISTAYNKKGQHDGIELTVF